MGILWKKEGRRRKERGYGGVWEVSGHQPRPVRTTPRYQPAAYVRSCSPTPHTNSREWHTWSPRDRKAAPTVVPCISTSRLKISPPFFGSTTLFFEHRSSLIERYARNHRFPPAKIRSQRPPPRSGRKGARPRVQARPVFQGRSYCRLPR